MKIAISGANSFIGKRIIQEALIRDWSIVAIVRDKSNNPLDIDSLPSVKVIKSEMSDYKHLGEKVGLVDCYIHLAWNGTRGTTRDDEELQSKNYYCGINAIESMIDAGCKRVLTAGSQAEYGLFDGVINEETPCNPNTEYGKYKYRLFEDAFSLCVSNEVDFKEPRFFSLYGPYDNPNTMIMSTLSCMLLNKPCKLTKCTQMWDFLYIDDAIEGILGLCEKKCKNGVYNFGSGDCRPLKEFINEMKRITCSKSELVFGAIPYTTAGIINIQPDISKLCREINWEPKTSFERGISHIIESLPIKKVDTCCHDS